MDIQEYIQNNMTRIFLLHGIDFDTSYHVFEKYYLSNAVIKYREIEGINGNCKVYMEVPVNDSDIVRDFINDSTNENVMIIAVVIGPCADPRIIGEANGDRILAYFSNCVLAEQSVDNFKSLDYWANPMIVSHKFEFDCVSYFRGEKKWKELELE